jgi:hypothetical protein
MDKPAIVHMDWYKEVFAGSADELIKNGILTKGGALLLAARPKIGKTQFALQLGYCLASGEPFLGFDTKLSRLYYLGFEMSPMDIGNRALQLSEVYLNTEDKYVAPMPDELPELYMDTDAGMQNFKTLMDDYKANYGCYPDVVILDTLTRIMKGKENSREDMTKLVSNLSKIGKDFGLTFVIIHHVRKAGRGKVTIDDVRGSTALPAWATSIIAMNEIGEAIELTFWLRSAPPLEPLIVKRNQQGIFEATVTEEEQSKQKLCELVIKQYLKQGEMELAELKERVAKDMECNPKTVERALNSMPDVERIPAAGTARKKARLKQ